MSGSGCLLYPSHDLIFNWVRRTCPWFFQVGDVRESRSWPIVRTIGLASGSAFLLSWSTPDFCDPSRFQTGAQLLLRNASILLKLEWLPTSLCHVSRNFVQPETVIYHIFIKCYCALFRLFRFQYPDFTFILDSYSFLMIYHLFHLFFLFPIPTFPIPILTSDYMTSLIISYSLVFIFTCFYDSYLFCSCFQYFRFLATSYILHSSCMLHCFCTICSELLWHSVHMTLHMILSAPIYLSPLWSRSIPTLYK